MQDFVNIIDDGLSKYRVKRVAVLIGRDTRLKDVFDVGADRDRLPRDRAVFNIALAQYAYRTLREHRKPDDDTCQQQKAAANASGNWPFFEHCSLLKSGETIHNGEMLIVDEDL